MTSAPARSFLSPEKALLLVLLAGIIAYSNSLSCPFIFDDLLALVDNTQLHSLNPFKYQRVLESTIAGRPLLIFSFSLNYAMAGLNVEIYHLTNLFIHLVAAAFLFGIIRRSALAPRVAGNRFSKAATLLATLVAGLWVVHPLNTQSVTYIVQRAESLAGMFMLASLYFFIRSARGNKGWAVAAVIASACGMASKEIVAALPILALLYDRAFLSGSFKDALRQRWKQYIALAATWVFIVYSLLTGLRGNMVGFHIGVTPLEYARTELNGIAHYLLLSFWPQNLVLDYADWPIARNWSDVSIQGWFVLVLVVCTAVALWRKPWLGFLGAWFFLILAPTSSFLPIKQEAVAEQRMYLPLAAVICVVVVGVWTLARNHESFRPIALIAACFIALALTVLTLRRNHQFSDAVVMWTDNINKRPFDARAHYGLATKLYFVSETYPPGSPRQLSASRQAAEQFQLIWRIDPNFPENVVIVGQTLDRAGESTAAENYFTSQLPSHQSIACQLLLERGKIRARRQDAIGAKADYLASIVANPRFAEPHYYLGLLYLGLNDPGSARREFAKALELAPGYKGAASQLQLLSQSDKGT